MISFDGELGARVLKRLASEIVIWLTTVSADGTPQPNPVWFLWDGETCLIYSQPDVAKVRNILRNPQVSLHFEGASQVGGDVIVLTGEARIELPSQPPSVDYRYKYRDAIQHSGLTWQQMQDEYSAAIFVQPKKFRGILMPEV